ncbi:hypothetical protein GCM10022259_36300 [Aquimarina mytili]
MWLFWHKYKGTKIALENKQSVVLRQIRFSKAESVHGLRLVMPKVYEIPVSFFETEKLLNYCFSINCSMAR